MCLVKNEADVIEQTLRSSLAWADHVFVYDNGSTDGTWEVVQRLSREHRAIVPFKSDARPFNDGLRAELFHAYRGMSTDGDWWCRLDADEFYVDDPKLFLSSVPQRYRVVWAAVLTYFFTDRDVAAYEEDPSKYGDDVPVQMKCRYYMNFWSEPRFFRYDRHLKWRSQGFPEKILFSAAYPKRILQRHFPYRSPQQIDRRLATRKPAVAAGGFVHEAVADFASTIESQRRGTSWTEASRQTCGADRSWQDRVVAAAELDYDAADGTFVVREDLMPKLPTAFSSTVDFAKWYPRETARRLLRPR